MMVLNTPEIVRIGNAQHDRERRKSKQHGIFQKLSALHDLPFEKAPNFLIHKL